MDEIVEPVHSKKKEFLCYVNRNKIKIGISAVVLGVLGSVFGVMYSNQVSDTRQAERARQERARDTFGTLNYLCSRMDILPEQIAQVIALSEEKKVLLESQNISSNTTIPIDLLTPEVQKKVVEINNKILEILKNIGAPSECKIPNYPGVDTTQKKR